MCFLKKHFHYLQMSCVALLSLKISIYEYGIIFQRQSVSAGHDVFAAVAKSRLWLKAKRKFTVALARLWQWASIMSRPPQLSLVKFTLRQNRKCETRVWIDSASHSRTFLLFTDKYLATVALACSLARHFGYFFFCFVIMGKTFDSLPEPKAWGLAQSHEQSCTCWGACSSHVFTTQTFSSQYLHSSLFDGILVESATW